jgi:hypothetical protein
VSYSKLREILAEAINEARETAKNEKDAPRPDPETISHLEYVADELDGLLKGMS